MRKQGIYEVIIYQKLSYELRGIDINIYNFGKERMAEQ